MAQEKQNNDAGKEGLPTPVWVLGVIIFVLATLYFFSS